MKRTAGILLYRQRDETIKVLLVSNGRHWSIPKGVQSTSETAVAAALRELKEEANLGEPERLFSLGAVQKDNRERMLCFLAEHSGGRPHPGNEIVSARFFDLARAFEIIQKYQLPFLRTALRKISSK